MPRSFATLTDDIITGAGTYTPPTTQSVSMWVKGPTLDATANRTFLSPNFAPFIGLPGNSTFDLKYQRSYNTSDGIWTCTAANHGATATNWNSIVWTYDGGATSNNPLCYVNGVSKTVTIGSVPTGTLDVATRAVCIGNQTAATSFAPGGQIAYVGIYNVILTQAEVDLIVRYGYQTRGLTNLWELYGSSPEPDVAGGLSGTVSGTAVTTGLPPIFTGAQNCVQSVGGR